MIANLYNIFSKISPKLKVKMWRLWYQFLALSYQRKDWKFMNFGYASLDGQDEIINLNKGDLENRFCIQLYHRVASSINLKNLDVLEVGCGRGGGADYLKRYFNPKKMIGLDFSENAIKFCNLNYAANGLSFENGNAESLPFADNCFDVIINIESSHCYGSMDAFLSQVKRVLRNEGYFLFADFRGIENVDILRDSLYKSGLSIVKETDISRNVLEAMELDNDRKIDLIKKAVYKPLIHTFLEFSGTKNSKIYNEFKSGKTVYLSFILQKLL